MHDLVRLFAQDADEVVGEERDGGLCRVIEWYLQALHDAAQTVRPRQTAWPAPAAGLVRVPPPSFPDAVAAAAWIDLEADNVEQLAHASAARGWNTMTWQLVRSPSPLLGLRLSNRRWVNLAQVGLSAATRERNGHAQATFHNSLGVAWAQQRDFVRAEEHLRAAIDSRDVIGDLDGAIVSRTNLAAVYGDSGQPQRAVAALQEVVALARAHQLSDREAAALNNVCANLLRLGDAEGTLRAAEQAIAAASRVGDARSLAYAQHHRADACAFLGRDNDAQTAYGQAAAHAEASSDTFLIASIYEGHGTHLIGMGRRADAEVMLRRALVLYRQLDAPEADGVARTLADCPDLKQDSGEPIGTARHST
jgi:tetratricopeptide (TPR) repeat protein